MGGRLLLIAETEGGTPGGCLSNRRSFTDFTSIGRDWPLSCSVTILIAAFTLLLDTSLSNLLVPARHFFVCDVAVGFGRTGIHNYIKETRKICAAQYSWRGFHVNKYAYGTYFHTIDLSFNWTSCSP